MEQQTCTIGPAEIILLGIIGFALFLAVRQLWRLVFSVTKSDKEYSDLYWKDEDPYYKKHREYVQDKKENKSKKYNYSGREVSNIDVDIDDSPKPDYSSVISHSNHSSGSWFSSDSGSSSDYGSDGGGDSGGGGGD